LVYFAQGQIPEASDRGADPLGGKRAPEFDAVDMAIVATIQTVLEQLLLPTTRGKRRMPFDPLRAGKWRLGLRERVARLVPSFRAAG